jgi:hypothetical protein
MAWEWVAPVATATVGVAGVFFTWLSGKQGRDHAEKLAEDARKQQRLESAYVRMVAMSEQVGHWAQMAYPLFDTNPPLPVPPLPELQEQAHVTALVKAFGSDEVLERMETWRTVVRKMLHTGRLIELEDKGYSIRQAGEPTARQDFDLELRPQERRTREALANQVAIELGHRTVSQPNQGQ